MFRMFSLSRKFTLLFFSIIFLLPSLSFSAYFRFEPVKFTQPDGSALNLFVSGDEYYNWIHDKDGYTILLNNDGFYVYAKKSGELLVPSALVVGKSLPSTEGIPKWLTQPRASIQKNYTFNYNVKKPYSDKKNQGSMLDNTGTLNNLVIFIRFSDEAEWTDNLSTYSDMFNGTTGNSMINYFKEASFNQLTVTSNFYPVPGGSTVVSYQDANPRGYYQPYSTTNTIGYTGGDGGTDRTNREHSLLINCVNAVKDQIPAGLNIDHDNDGYVDNVCFIVSGTPTGWASLLWPHRWALYTQTATINGKRVWDYNFQIRSMTLSSGPGVLCHEMFHTLGSPDLYHYSYDGLQPVYAWDLMENNSNPPQHMGAYMKYRYGGWISSIPEITATGTYTLNPITSSVQNCYKIKSPVSTTEYYVVEYRKKTGTFESSVPGSGLLVYRINTAEDGNGNSSGPPDEVYIYRPGGTTASNGTPGSANYTSDVGRTAISSSTSPNAYLSNGSEGYLDISQVSAAGSTISFKVTIGVPTIPTLVAPADNSTGNPLRPTFSWNTFSGAIGYNLQISTTNTFSSITYERTGLTSTSLAMPSDLDYNTTYYWHVNAVTGAGTTGWSTTFTFTTIPSIRIDSIVGSLCAGNYFNVYYSVGAAFDANNVFSVQLSDTLGKFIKPTEVGQLGSNTSGYITCQLPDTMPGGSRYRMRVIGTYPATNGSDNGSDLTITPALVPFVNGPLSVCETNTYVYQTSAIKNISNRWVVTGGTIIGKPDSSIISIAWGKAGTGKIKIIKASIAGCSDSVTKTVTINPLPTPELTGNLNVCENAQEFYTSDLDAGTKNTWSVTGGKILSFVSEKMIKVGWGAAGKGSVTLTQTVTATNCSNSTSINVTIQKSPTPDTIAGSKTVCPMIDMVYYSVAKSGTKNLWSVSNGQIIGQNNHDSVTVQWYAFKTGTLKMIQTLLSTGCTDTVSVDVQINPRPDPGIQGNSWACSSREETYRTVPDNSMINFWSAEGGKIITPPTLDTVSVRWDDTTAGKVSLLQTIVATGCSQSTELDVVITQLPAKPSITRSQDTLFSSWQKMNVWYYNGILISGANDNFYVPKENGKYSVEAVSKNCISDRSDEYNYNYGSVADASDNHLFTVSPNPSTGKISLHFNNAIEAGTYIRIFDLLGNQLMFTDCNDLYGKTVNFDLKEFGEGMYFISVFYKNRTFFEKIILKK